MNFLDDLPAQYRLILCDLWGCVHDGWTIFPGVVERLRGWKEEGRTILFLTNAPRTGAAIQRQLDALGLPTDLHDGIVTAGEAGAAALLGKPVGFCGTPADRADLQARGLTFVADDYAELACAGLASGETVADYADALARWRTADVLMHCLNPDRIVIHQGETMICAGALADAYKAMGGRVIWHGKPYPSVYDYALRLADSPPKEQVLAIGDGLQTDVLGAALYDIDCVFVQGGIHAGEPFPTDFSQQHGLGDWRPTAVVPTLGQPNA